MALASTAEIRAASSIAVIFQVADNPSGIGKMVLYPWMTSIPKISGIRFGLLSNANCWVSRIFAAPSRFRIAPISLRLIRSPVFESTAGPEMIEPSGGMRFVWPIFSSMVIRLISSSMNRSISASVPDDASFLHPPATAAQQSSKNCKCFFISIIFLSLSDGLFERMCE